MVRIHRPPTSWIVPLLLGLATPGVTAQQEAPPATQQEFLDRVVALARSAPRPDPVGDHSIRGRVVTAAGAPVAGVRVRATTTKELYGRSDRRAFSEEDYWNPDLASSMSATVTAWWRRAARSREATTTADGTFVLDHLDDGAFDVRASCAGFGIEGGDRGPNRSVVVASDSSVEFVAYPTTRRIFDLRLPDGSQPQRATLGFERNGRRNWREQARWTPDDPAVELPAGDWIVTAASGGDASRYLSTQNSSWLSKETAVVSPPPDGNDTMRIELRGACALAGNVVPPRSRPNASFGVHAVRLAAGQEPDPERFLALYRKGSYGEPSARTQWTRDGAISYRFDHLEPGRWYVGVFRQRPGAPVVAATFDVGEKVVEHDFVVPEGVADDDLRIRVLDPAGALLRDCSFRCVTYAVGPNGAEFAGGANELSFDRGADGTYSRPPVASHEHFALLAEHPRFGTCATDVPADAREVSVRFVEPVAVALRVPGFTDGTRGRRVAIEWSQSLLGMDVGSSKRIDADDVARDDAVEVGPLQPGRYRLSIALEPDRASGRSAVEVASRAWDVTAATKTMELPFPELAPLRIRVAAKELGGYSLGPVDRPDATFRSSQSVYSDKDGGIEFVDVAPGLYVVRGSGGRSMLVEAPAKGVVAFVDEEVKVLRVVIRDPSGPLAKAGLATGDRVVAIDGREFAGRMQLGYVRQALKGNEVTLTIQRGDQRFEIVVARKYLEDGTASGGSFLEASR